MKTKLLLLLTLLVSAFSWGQVNITPPRSAVAGFSTWTDVDVAGTTYIQLLKSTSSTETPSMNFDSYTNETLDFTARTFGTVTSGEHIITVSISTNDGANWTILGTRTPTTNGLLAQTQFDLSGYSGTQVKIKFSVAGTNDAIGVGIAAINIRGIAPTCTPPSDPTGSITVSANPSCGTATLSYPAGFYWQTTATGTSTSLPTSSNYSLASSGTIYVRAYDGVNCWSTNAISSGSVTVNSPVNVTAQPVNTSVVAGSNTSFSVTASNVANYQWQVDTGSGFVNLSNIAPYSNVTTSTLSVTGATASMNNYQYRCVMTASSPCSTVNSNAATLMVTIPLAPVIASSLTKSTVYGNTDTYTITASNSPTSYSTGTLPTGFTLSGAVITKAALVDAETYSITISATNAGGTDSKTLVWTVTKANPSFNPSSINLSIGGTQTITSSSTEGTLSFSSDNATIASVGTSSGIVTGVAAGTTTINVSQVASTNYNAGTATVTVNVSTVSYNDGDYWTTNNGNWHGTANSGSANTWQRYNGITWVNVPNSPPSNLAGLGTGKVYIQHEITIIGTNTAPNVIVNDGGKLYTSTTTATFGNLLVKSGGEYYRQSTGSGVSGNFEIENGGSAYVELNHSTPSSASSSIFAGTEKFHENSNFIIIRTHNTNNYIPDFSNISLFNGAYFGNLIIDQSSGNSINLLPTGYNGVLTNGNLIFKTAINDIRLSNSSYTATIKGDLIIENTFNGRKVNLYAGTTGTGNLNIDGNIIHNGNDNINLNTQNGGSMNLNLKGDLTVGSNSKLLSTATSNSIFNFTGTGNGTTDALTQTIDVANAATASNIAFNVNSGSYTKLINQDFSLGTNSTFTVKTGGTFDFGFNGTNGSGNTSLNITNNGSSTTFTSQSGSTLKITSPDGITTTASLGNVQTPIAGRTYNPGATYHYIGKANATQVTAEEADQITGNGLPDSGITGKVIVELDTDELTFHASSNNRSFDATGTLEIRKGIVIDNSTYSFNTNASQYGNLTMSGGRYRISKGSASVQPPFSGTYNLTGGVVEFANTIFTAGQSIRSKSYQNIEVTGTYVNNSNGDTTYNPIVLNNNGTFTITGTGKFTSSNGYVPVIGSTNNTKLTVETGGRFVTAVVPGFYGSASAQPYQSVQNSIENIVLEPGSIVEYARKQGEIPFGASLGDQTITHTNFGTLANPYSYQNLHISGSGNKTLQHNTATRVNENLEVLDLAGNSAILKIGVGEVITVQKAVKVPTTATAKMVIENNGQLIQIKDTDPANLNSGTNFEMKRVATVTVNDYVYWSSPTDNFNVNSIPNSNLRYQWDAIKYNSNGTQGNWVTAAGSIMAKGKGYIVRVPVPTPSSATVTDTTKFAGTPRNGTVTVDIFRGNRLVDETNVTRFDDNWNLVGNPYPSAISALEFLQTNGANLVDTDPSTPTPTVPATTIVGAVWIWKHGIDLSSGNQDPFYYNFANNYSSTDYIKFNGTGSTDPDFDGFIGAGQGFMISMKDNAFGEVATDISGNPEASLLINDFVPYENKVVFTNSMRVNDSGGHYDNNQFFRTANAENSVAADDEKHRIWLDIIKTSNGQTDTALIGYVSNATMGEDNLYDTFFMPRNEVSLYSLINTNSFIIQGRSLPFDTTDLVPLGMKIISAGNHTIAIRQVDGIFEGNQNIYLEDKQLNIIHDLKQSPYHFTAPTGVNNTRFVLRYTTNALGNADFDYDNQVVVFSKNNTVTINSSIQNIDEVQVYDVLGRQLYQNTAVENQEHSFAKDIAQQTIIVKVKLQNGIWVTKKVLVK